jgi:hypothetical protein
MSLAVEVQRSFSRLRVIKRVEGPFDTYACSPRVCLCSVPAKFVPARKSAAELFAGSSKTFLR